MINLMPGQQNIVQRIGLFTTLTSIALVIFLHFPFDGYINERHVTTRFGFGSCPNGLEDLARMGSEKFSQEMERCNDLGELKPIPFSEWRSKSAIFWQLASPTRAIAAAAFITIIGITWIFIFRSKRESST